MKRKLNIGFVTTVSGRWPRELPKERNVKYAGLLKDMFPDCKVVTLNSYVDSMDTMREAVREFKAREVDVIVSLYGAFSGDDYGTMLWEELEKPIILWTLKEPELNGGRLLANALVAATMNSASIKRIDGICHFIFGNEDDERVVKELKAYITSYKIKKALKNTMLGLVGYRPTAFYNSAFDEGLIRRIFGMKIEETSLKMIFDKMEEYSEEEVKAEVASIGIPAQATLPEGYIENHARLAMAMRSFFEENNYQYITLKCWPEMGALKTTPCAVIGRLADEGKHIICEGDVDAGIAYIVENIITDKPAFVTDLIDIDEVENTVTVWHCGNAAPSIISDKCQPEIGNHPLAGQGTAIRCVLKEGEVTFARFCNIGGVYKLFIARGEAVPTTMYTPGAMVKIKIKTPVREAIYKIIEEEVPHHYAVVWEDVADEMIAFATLCGMEIIEV